MLCLIKNGKLYVQFLHVWWLKKPKAVAIALKYPQNWKIELFRPTIRPLDGGFPANVVLWVKPQKGAFSGE